MEPPPCGPHPAGKLAPRHDQWGYRRLGVTVQWDAGGPRGPALARVGRRAPPALGRPRVLLTPSDVTPSSILNASELWVLPLGAVVLTLVITAAATALMARGRTVTRTEALVLLVTYLATLPLLAA